MNLKEYIFPFIIGYIFASLLFIFENMSLRHKNKQLTSAIDNITAIVNTFVSLGEKELKAQEQAKKEGEKSNGQI